MSQMNSENLFFDDTDDEAGVNSLVCGFLKDAALVIQAFTPTIRKYQRNHIVRDRYGAHDRLVHAYFAKEPFYNRDAVGKAGISVLVNCTSAIRQLAYDVVPYSLDEYLQIGDKTSRACLMAFCNGVMELYGKEFLRRPTQTDVEKLYAFHEEKHGFPGMIGSIDCTKWSWAQCPQAYRAQFSRGDSGLEPFILLEAVASQDLWIWHAFFGVAGSNDDVNGYKQAHEATRKDVERAFGVLKKKWAIVRTPARTAPKSPLAEGRWLHGSEEELLATCYVAVSFRYNNVGRSQKHDTFWYRVLNEFNSKKFQNRTKDMLTSKWHTLNANCQKFNAAYKRAKRLGKSGENDVDYLKRAQSIYRDEHRGVAFSQEDAWAVLRFHPKWDAPEQVDLTGDVPGASQEDLFGHDARPRPPGKQRPAKKSKSDATASTGGSSASAQFGELMEQELRLKREAAERAFEAQAEKDRTLMRLEELRFLATSTKDLDEDDAYWIKKQKKLIKNKMKNDLGDEDDEDEDE
ncbi:transposon ty3-I gag-pol polyprotein [Tanacetum coccineum]